MIKIAFLGSGSKGNATLISDGVSLILIDMGLTKARLIDGCALFAKQLKDIDAAFFTHNHNDHLSGHKYLPKELKVYASFDFKEPPSASLIKAGDNIRIGDIQVTALSASHDAPNPLSYLIQVGEEKLAYITDTGYIPKKTFKAIVDCDYYLLESNHDPSLEAHSGRSAALVARVLGKKGHLSNEDSAKYFLKAHGEKTKACYLAHLSDDCNTPELALKTYYEVANKLGVDIHDIELIPTKQNEVVFGGEGW